MATTLVAPEQDVVTGSSYGWVPVAGGLVVSLIARAGGTLLVTSDANSSIGAGLFAHKGAVDC